MKNITITVNDDLYRHARICAAHRNITVTELVRSFLMGLETVPGRRTRAAPNHLAAHENTLIAHIIRTHLPEVEGVSGEMNTPPPLFPCENVKL